MKILLLFINTSQLQPYFFFTSMTTYGFLIWQTYYFFLIYANIFWICPHPCINKNTNAPEVLHWQPQICDICKPHLFLQIYDPYSIPCLTVIFVSCTCLWSYFTVTIHISHWNCTCVYIQNTNVHEVLSQQPQIIPICKPYLFFNIYEPFNISCLEVISVFYKCLWIFTANHKY